jgi:hypothetical protein
MTLIMVAGIRIWVDYRRGIGGDEGLRFVVTVVGQEDGARILRFDCFSKTPHDHVGASEKSPVHDMNAVGIKDPVRWTSISSRLAFRPWSPKPDILILPRQSTSKR